jgi:hypothetical protein
LQFPQNHSANVRIGIASALRQIVRRRDMLVLTGPATASGSNSWQLGVQQAARSERPDGSVVAAANAAGLAYGWVASPAPGMAPVAMLRLGVNSPQTTELLPGGYQLAFDAAQVAVSGP